MNKINYEVYEEQHENDTQCQRNDEAWNDDQGFEIE